MADEKLRLIKDLRVVIVGPHIRDRDERVKLLHFFCQRKARQAVLIGHPPSGVISRRSVMITCKRGSDRKAILSRWKEIRYLSYLADLAITVWFLMVSRSRYDVYFGFGISYTPLGLVLRRLGIVKRVIFWTTDYFPEGTGSNRLTNRIYNAIHKTCVESSDYIWDASPAIKQARSRRGLNIKDETTLTVPYMLGREEIEALPAKQIGRYHIIQTGLMSNSEFFIILEAVKIVTATISQVMVSIVSYSAIPQAWRDEIKERGLEHNFNILGYIEDEAEVSIITREHRVGLAIYESDSFKKYGDPARVKHYLAKGVPVIITRGPLVWKEVVSHSAGIAIDYSSDELAIAIIRLLTDDQFYEECQNGALKLAIQYEAETIFLDTLQRMRITCDENIAKSGT